ncbi:MAG: PIN domain-containing protein [Neisseriaceae bacterium]
MNKNLLAVLDASALLEFIKNENGSSSVRQIISNSVMTSINVTEVIIALGRIHPERLLHYHNVVNQIITNIYESDSELSLVVSDILIKYRKEHNISLGDGYCLALGKFLDLPIYTGDNAWSGLEQKLNIEIRYIR